MIESRDIAPSARPAVRVLLVGGGSEGVAWVQSILDQSRSRRFDLSHARDLAHAADVLETDKADIMLLDLSQRSDSELDTLTQTWLRAPLIPVVVMSDVDDETFALATLQHGAHGFLLKCSVDTRLLVTTLEAALESHLTTLQLRMAREQALHLATHDPVTRLANRASFKERLAQAVGAARRSRWTLAVLFLDIDSLDRVQQTAGDSGRDHLLVQIAERLLGCVRLSDAVARFSPSGYDGSTSSMSRGEFTLQLSQLSDPQDAARVAGRVLDVLSEPFTVNGHEVFASANLGIAVYPHDGETAETLLRNADQAMIHAKGRGRNTYEFHDRSLNAEVSRKLHLEKALQHALEREELSVHYQPVRRAVTGEVLGVEALLRWEAHELGNVEPEVFIPISEKNGLILPIGEWVLRTACEQAQAWRNAGYRPLRLSVNLSAYQLAQPSLVDLVERVLAETGYSPGQLELEVTESTLTRDDGATAVVLEALRARGVGIALDDFGTGVSSLNSLRRFPIDRLKIDRCLVSDIAENEDDAALTAAVVTLAHSLKLGVVAEGVETREQAELLRENGCDELQGFLFSPAVPPAEFARFLQRAKRE